MVTSGTSIKATVVTASGFHTDAIKLTFMPGLPTGYVVCELAQKFFAPCFGFSPSPFEGDALAEAFKHAAETNLIAIRQMAGAGRGPAYYPMGLAIDIAEKVSEAAAKSGWGEYLKDVNSRFVIA